MTKVWLDGGKVLLPLVVLVVFPSWGSGTLGCFATLLFALALAGAGSFGSGFNAGGDSGAGAEGADDFLASVWFAVLSMASVLFISTSISLKQVEMLALEQGLVLSGSDLVGGTGSLLFFWGAESLVTALLMMTWLVDLLERSTGLTLPGVGRSEAAQKQNVARAAPRVSF